MRPPTPTIRGGDTRLRPARSAAAAVGVPLGFGVAFLFTDQVEQVMADVHRVERWLALGALAALVGAIAWLAVRNGQRARRLTTDEADGEKR